MAAISPPPSCVEISTSKRARKGTGRSSEPRNTKTSFWRLLRAVCSRGCSAGYRRTWTATWPRMVALITFLCRGTASCRQCRQGSSLRTVIVTVAYPTTSGIASNSSRIGEPSLAHAAANVPRGGPRMPICVEPFVGLSTPEDHGSSATTTILRRTGSLWGPTLYMVMKPIAAPVFRVIRGLG